MLLTPKGLSLERSRRDLLPLDRRALSTGQALDSAENSDVKSVINSTRGVINVKDAIIMWYFSASQP